MNAYTMLTLLICGIRAQKTPVGADFNVGSVLFSKSDVNKIQWSKADIALLQARQQFQLLLPTPQHVYPNKDFTDNLINYFRDAYDTIHREATSPELDTIMTMALSDTLGGYLKFFILPITKFGYYGGTINKENAKRLFCLYTEVKRYLGTNGDGWQKPTEDVLEYVNIVFPRSRRIAATEPHGDPCDNFIYFEKSGTGYTIPVPIINWDDETMFLPFKNNALVPLCSSKYQNILLSYYNTALACLESKKKNSSTDFQNKFQTWLQKEVLTHLSDENLYLALDSVLSLVKGNNTTNRHFTYKGELVPEIKMTSFIKTMYSKATSFIQRHRTSIFGFVLIFEILWCIFALHHITMKKRSRKDCDIFMLFKTQRDPPSDDHGGDLQQERIEQIYTSHHSGIQPRIVNRSCEMGLQKSSNSYKQQNFSSGGDLQAKYVDWNNRKKSGDSKTYTSDKHIYSKSSSKTKNDFEYSGRRGPENIYAKDKASNEVAKIQNTYENSNDLTNIEYLPDCYCGNTESSTNVARYCDCPVDENVIIVNKVVDETGATNDRGNIITIFKKCQKTIEGALTSAQENASKVRHTIAKQSEQPSSLKLSQSSSECACSYCTFNDGKNDGTDDMPPCARCSNKDIFDKYDVNQFVVENSKPSIRGPKSGIFRVENVPCRISTAQLYSQKSNKKITAIKLNKSVRNNIQTEDYDNIKKKHSAALTIEAETLSYIDKDNTETHTERYETLTADHISQKHRYVNIDNFIPTKTMQALKESKENQDQDIKRSLMIKKVMNTNDQYVEYKMESPTTDIMCLDGTGMLSAPRTKESKIPKRTLKFASHISVADQIQPCEYTTPEPQPIKSLRSIPSVLKSQIQRNLSPATEARKLWRNSTTKELQSPRSKQKSHTKRVLSPASTTSPVSMPSSRVVVSTLHVSKPMTPASIISPRRTTQKSYLRRYIPPLATTQPVQKSSPSRKTSPRPLLQHPSPSTSPSRRHAQKHHMRRNLSPRMPIESTYDATQSVKPPPRWFNLQQHSRRVISPPSSVKRPSSRSPAKSPIPAGSPCRHPKGLYAREIKPPTPPPRQFQLTHHKLRNLSPPSPVHRSKSPPSTAPPNQSHKPALRKSRPFSNSPRQTTDNSVSKRKTPTHTVKQQTAKQQVAEIAPAAQSASPRKYLRKRQDTCGDTSTPTPSPRMQRSQDLYATKTSKSPQFKQWAKFEGNISPRSDITTELFHSDTPSPRSPIYSPHLSSPVPSIYIIEHEMFKSKHPSNKKDTSCRINDEKCNNLPRFVPREVTKNTGRRHSPIVAPVLVDQRYRGSSPSVPLAQKTSKLLVPLSSNITFSLNSTAKQDDQETASSTKRGTRQTTKCTVDDSMIRRGILSNSKLNVTF